MGEIATMGIMQKEIREYKKSRLIIEGVIILSIMIFIGRVFDGLKLDGIMLSKFIDPIIILATIGVIIILVRNYQTKYKYSVVANQFLVHKFSEHKQELLENVKIRDIIYLGKDASEVNNVEIACSHKYTCSSKDRYCCVYNKDGVVRKFYFQASAEFVSKINLVKEKEKEIELNNLQLV
ncbi:MAG: hypothetical protein ACRC41_01740 [Sarcina sp.]